MDRNNKANHTPQSVILTTLLMLCTTVFTANAQAAMELYFIHNDHLGTPQAVTDQNQNIVWRKHQKPFGETTEETGTLDPHLRFPGQYFDEETGYHYNYFRDYDPTTGRYIQSDPIGFLGGLNTYAYALANPLLFIDPMGETAIIIRPYFPLITRPFPYANSLPRNPSIPVDPSPPLKFPEKNDCDVKYFEDSLQCEVQCESNAISLAFCKTKAWYKWIKCKNTNPPARRPQWPDDGFPGFQDPGLWTSIDTKQEEEEQLGDKSDSKQFVCAA